VIWETINTLRERKVSYRSFIPNNKVPGCYVESGNAIAAQRGIYTITAQLGDIVVVMQLPLSRNANSIRML
jgi:hypothetical protein